MDDRAPSMLKSTLIGGSALGFAAALPLVGAVNACCCALVIGGGFLAAYLYSRECTAAGSGFGPGGGAMVGLVAGLFYALATTVTSGLVQLAMGTNVEEALQQIEAAGVEFPPEAEPWLDFVINASPLLLLALGFCFWLLIAAIFSTVGGVIGGMVFKVEPREPTADAGASPTV